MIDGTPDERTGRTLTPATELGFSVGDQVRLIGSDRFAQAAGEGPGMVRSVIAASAEAVLERYAVEFSSGSRTLVGGQLRFARRLSDWCNMSLTQFLKGGITGPWYWVTAAEDIRYRRR